MTELKIGDTVTAEVTVAEKRGRQENSQAHDDGEQSAGRQRDELVVDGSAVVKKVGL